MTIPGRTWIPTAVRRHALVIEETDPGDTEVALWIGDMDDPGGPDGRIMLLDVAATGELVSDLLRRLAVMAGRQAAIEAAADGYVVALAATQPSEPS